MLRLRDLEVFNTVMRAGKMTEAARLLHVSQPAVSKTIKDMEAGLGINLFERTGGRLVPTTEAEILFRDVSALFNRVGNIRRLVQELRDNLHGNIVIATSPTLAHTILPEAVSKFRKTYEHVGFQIHCLTSLEVAEAVIRQEADFGLMYNWLPNTLLEAEPISNVEIGCIMRADNPLVRKRVVEPRDLVGQQLISYAENTPLGHKIADAIGRQALGSQPPVHVSYGLTACHLTKELGGVSLADSAILASSAFPGLVVRPFRPRITATVDICVAYDSPVSRTASTFIELLKTLGREYASRRSESSALANEMETGRTPAKRRKVPVLQSSSTAR